MRPASSPAALLALALAACARGTVSDDAAAGGDAPATDAPAADANREDAPAPDAAPDASGDARADAFGLDASRDASADAGADAGIDAALPPGDSVPTGAVSFFHTTRCPVGWQPYAPAAGRALLPTPPGGTEAAAVGTPLVTGVDPTHGHGAAGAVTLPDVSYVGASGNNNSLTPSGAVPLAVTLGATSSGLPLIQLLACRKAAAPSSLAAPPPSGMALFFDLRGLCPSGWSPNPSAAGRYVVALPSGGTQGATFGGAPLGDQELRSHTHPVPGSVTAASHGIALATGCCGSGYAAQGTHAFTAASDPAVAAVPYVQLAQCVKD